MASLMRSVFAVLAGFVVAAIVMMAIEMVNGRFLYPEIGKAAQGLTDREAIRQLMAGAPLGALLVVVAGWLIASVAGGFVAGWVARRAPIGHALLLGGLLTLGGVANNLMLPPPLWFWIAGLIVFIPAAYAGGRLVPRR